MCALIPKSHSLFFFLFLNKCNTQCHKVPRKVFTQKQAGRQRHTHTSKLPVLYLSACQQDVTVPAFSSKFLSQTALFFSPVQFSLIVLSALFSLPPWLSLPPFFLFPLSFVPSPTTLYHLSPDSLSVSHGTASIWDTEQKTLSDNRCWTSSGAFVLSFPGPAALRCSESGHCARGDVGILGEGGQGGVQSDVYGSYEEVLCCVCCSPSQSVSVISDVLISKYYDYSLEPKRVLSLLKVKQEDGARDRALNKTFLIDMGQPGRREGEGGMRREG